MSSIPSTATRPWPQFSTVRCAIEGKTAKGVPWANILWSTAALSGAFNPDDLTVFALNVYTSYKTHILPLLGSDLTLEACVANYYGAQPQQWVASHLETSHGGSANITEVDSLSACLSWRIGQTWRGGKPRTYIPGLPKEAFQDSNTLSASFIAALQAGGEAMRSTWRANSHSSIQTTDIGVQSFFSGNAPRAAGVMFLYQAVVVHPRIDSMRRRLGRERT